MASKKQLEKKLADLRDSLDAVPDEFKADIQKEIDETEKELATATDDDGAKAKPSRKAPESGDDFLKAMLSTIAAQMAAGEGSGVDSPTVRAIIKEYLGSDKVKLDELDKSVLEEIKKNQTLILSIPAFGKKIQVSKDISMIPNFFDIIDDVFAGNNVYLIGEAGGGKTYTAEMVAKTLEREYVTLNCSQYTSPLEILGGQSIEGFKQGKLIDCWKNGKVLILDEMPKLDANTAGLFNDALAKSSKTKSPSEAKINSANAEEPPIERNDTFAVIATGNIYPNEPPAPQYRGNNQQDLSLLDRFSGSVYYTEFDNNTDQRTCRFQFLYDSLVGNYYEYIDAKKKGTALPAPRGLRTVIESLNLKNLALVSYRTNIAFRVGFEYQLVRAIAKAEGEEVMDRGKTLLKTFKSYMVAFKEGSDAYNNIIRTTKYTDDYVTNLANTAIREITKNKDGFLNSLTRVDKSRASNIFDRYKDFYVTNPSIKGE
ncbi:MAG: AAA family ATPase [Bacteroidetes bacterium]|nr:AAA family ATPase [Bacteroidota bacterium]